ncbi:siphovirus Gp157 family protein [Bacillus paralicheniformis]|uniref:siphovirus Gp157 family protein n=1 Tax=Bacillus paralicheniformis TaxID=1648923 RepID=UPI003A8686F0
MNLYELTDQYKAVLDMADTLDPETLKDTLEAIQEPIQEKLTNIVYLIRSLEGNVQLIKDEEARLSKKRKTTENHITRLKDMLKDHVEAVGQPMGKSFGVKIKGNPHISKIYIQKNPPSAKVLDPDLIPEQFKIKQPDKVNAKAILAAWKEGKITDENERAFGIEINQGESVRYS